MATTKLQSVEVADPQVSQKKKISGTSSPIRVRQRTKLKLEQLLKQANKDRMGRRIKADDLIWCGLSLVTGDHIAEICANSLSNKDRLEILFQKFQKAKKGATREEFLGALLEGKLTQ